MHELYGRDVLNHGGGERVSQLYSRDVLADGCDRVCDLPDRNVFGDIGGGMPGVPGERDVGGGERVPGVLLLQERVRARGGVAHVPDLQPRDVEQPDGTYGVLELLGGVVLGELRRDRQRDVRAVCAGGVVARGQSELQFMSYELAGGERERVPDELRLRRGVYGGEWGHLHGMRGG